MKRFEKIILYTALVTTLIVLSLFCVAWTNGQYRATETHAREGCLYNGGVVDKVTYAWEGIRLKAYATCKPFSLGDLK